MDRLLNTANWGRKPNNDHDSSQRRKQVESLLTEVPQLRLVSSDDSRFQLTLQLSNSPESPLSTSTPHLPRTTSSSAVNSSVNKDSSVSGGSTAAVAASTAALTVYLPPAFPEEEPKITIHPTVRHLWVDGTVSPCAVTGHERLMPGGWSTHANLGKIVKEIVLSIQRTGVLVGGLGAGGEINDTPGLNGIMNNNTSSSDTSNGGSGANSNNNNNNNTNVAYDEYSHKPPPPIPGIRTKSLGQGKNNNLPSFTNTNGSPYQLQGTAGVGSSSSSSAAITGESTQKRPQLQSAYNSNLSPEARIIMELNTEQLEELLESPVAFEHFVDHLEMVINSRTLKREWWLGNDNVARRNLALEAEMTELQQSTAEGHKVVMQLQKSLEEKLQQQQDALWRFKPETLQSKLRSAAAESDELSESIAQSFLEGKLDQDGFIRQYRDLRKVYHLREMKNERMGSILRNHPSSVTPSASTSTSVMGMTGSSSGLDGSSASILKPGVLGVGMGMGMGAGTGSGSGTGSSSSSAVGGGASGPGGPGTSDAWVML